MFRSFGAAFGAVLLVLGPAFAQSGKAPERPITLDLTQPRAAASADASALLAKARARGVVRVIAGVNLKLGAPADLAAPALLAQQRALRAAQDGVVARVLGSNAAGSEAVRFETIPYVSLFVDAGQLQRLLADREVVNIQEDVPLPPTLLESIPLINADDVWAAGYRGVGYSVAVLDTGVDKNHPMLAGKVISEACYSTEIGRHGVRTLCPRRQTESTAPDSGLNCVGVEGCDHGTHVAGIAAGKPWPGAPLAGVARGANIIAIQVFSRFNYEPFCWAAAPCLQAFNTDVIRGLERVYQLRHRIAAVNLSLGGGYPSDKGCDDSQWATRDVIRLLRSVRIATVIASGNNGYDGMINPPSCISAAIAVGSTLDTADALSDFSNHAPQVRLLAPGSGIVSSVPGGGTAEKDGTSMATPHVAGAFALLRQVHPEATIDDIAAALECTGVPVSRADIVEPRIDVEAARAYLLDPPNRASIFEFDDEADATAWPPLMGTFSIDRSHYVSDGAPGWKIASIANCNESLIVQARMRRVDNNPTAWNSGIFFKAALHPTAKTFSGYFFGFNKLNGGNVFITRLHGFELDAAYGGWATVICNQNIPINLNRFNTLRVESRGGAHRAFFNGAEICNVTDHTFGTGSVAVASYIPEGARGDLFQVNRVMVIPKEIRPPRRPGG